MADEYQEIDQDLSTSDPVSVREERAATPETPGVIGALGEMAGQTTGDLFRAYKHFAEPPVFQRGTLKGMSSPEELNEKYALKGENRFTKWTSDESAEEMVQALHKREKTQEKLALFDKSHNWLVRNAVGFIGGMLDPVEAAAMMVPGVGEERLAFKMIEAGYGIEKSVVAGKLVAGSTGAMAGTAALEPLRFGMSADELRDWSMKDALTNVFYAAPLGAMMHAGLSPAIGYGVSHLNGSKPSAYFHDQYYPEYPKGLGFDDFTRADMQASVIRGVEAGTFDASRPPSFGHIKELADMNVIDRNAMQRASVAQIMDGREPNAGSLLFPDHSAEARKLAPEAHEEWDRLQAEHDRLATEHVWGAQPTPEQLNDPAWRLEQELRDHVRNILPVSWDLRVAAGEIPDMGEGGMAHLAETPAEHVNEPTKPVSLETVSHETSPAFKIVDDKGAPHDVKVEKLPDGNVKFSIGDDAAQVKLKQRPDNRWEVAWMTVDKSMRGSGVMGKIYDAIEREYGNQMIPSGLLREGGYNFWKKRNPDLVKYHQQVQGYGKDYLSPRFIKEQIEEFTADLEKAKAAKDRPAMAELQSDLKPWREAWNRVPAEGKSPEAIKRMFSFGGEGAANPPKGLDKAKAMEAENTASQQRPLTGTFASRVASVVYAIGDTRPSFGKTAISEAYEAYARVYSDAGTLSDFKKRLVDEAKERNLDLSRLEMPERMTKEMRDASAASWDGDTVHYIESSSPEGKARSVTFKNDKWTEEHLPKFGKTEPKYSREEIWEKTGWHKGETGHWLFEIDDSKATINEQVLADTSRPYKGPLSGVFNHEALF
jgi:hypothetical protein